MLFRTVGIKVRLENFSTFTRAKTHSRYTDDKALMEEFVMALFSEFETSKRKFRLVGVRVSSLTKADARQETILTWTNDQQQG
jgi:DNA polymerase IV (DinB-like DNA polymerase)